MATIAWTKAKLETFKVAYKEAKDAGVSSFIFEGHSINTQYAKYLIQYLERELKDD